MRDRAIHRCNLTIVALALSVCACAGQPRATSPTTTATMEPAAPSPTDRSSVSPAGSPSGSLPVDPPAAALAVEGGDPVVGRLGSYTWQGGGSDSPWLPGASIAAAVGEPMTLTLGSGVGVASWTASRVEAGTADGIGAIGLGSGTDAIAFVAPAPGAWSVQVAIRFADDLGSAAYYWQLTVR